MKIFCYLLSALSFSAFVLTGCDDETGNKQIEISDKSALTQTAYADDETTAGFTFTAESEWTATVSEKTRASGVEWLRLLLDGYETYEGKAGTYTMVIEIDANYTGESRQAAIVIKCGDDSITVTVTQQATTEDGENLGEQEPDRINGGTFVYKLHSGYEYSFPVDGATFKNNKLTFQARGGADAGVYAEFHFADGSTLQEGTYQWANYTDTGADKFYCQKGEVNGRLWYATADKGTIVVTVDDEDYYSIDFMLYIRDDSEIHNGQITGEYRGLVTGE